MTLVQIPQNPSATRGDSCLHVEPKLDHVPRVVKVSERGEQT